MFSDVCGQAAGGHACGPRGVMNPASNLRVFCENGWVRIVKRARTEMANNPKKVKDPTEVALSAIQEALNISDTTVDPNRNSIGGDLSPPTMPSGTPSFPEPSFDTRGSADRPMFDQIEEPRPRRA